MASTRSGRCEFCGDPAVAFQRDSLVCAQCGTQRTLGQDPASTSGRTARRRGATFGVISSGLVVKLILGTAAFAAVGSFATSVVLPTSLDSPDTTEVGVLNPGTQTTSTDGEASPYRGFISDEQISNLIEAAQSQADEAREHAETAQAWADCISSYAREHPDDQLNPTEFCGEGPSSSRGNDKKTTATPGQDVVPTGDEKTNNKDKDRDKDNRADQSENSAGNGRSNAADNSP